jgi:hypothetical protein
MRNSIVRGRGRTKKTTGQPINSGLEVNGYL